MPVKKDAYWEERVKSLKANNPPWGAGRIGQALEQEAANKGREDAPGERWVGNVLKKLKDDPKWSQLEGEYRYFHWPESMERGELPWEASAAALELLKLIMETQVSSLLFPLSTRYPFSVVDRPDIRLVKWFWRVTLAWHGRAEAADPELYLHCRFMSAVLLTLMEEFPDVFSDKSWVERQRRKVEELLVRGMPDTTVDEELRRLLGSF